MAPSEPPTDPGHQRSSCRLSRSLSSLDELFRFVEANVAGAAVDPRTIFVVKLAAEEIFTNFLRHNDSDQESISIEIEVSGERVVLRLLDRDVDPFDAATLPRGRARPRDAEVREGGFGLHLVRSLSDELSYECENGDMKVTVVKHVGG